MKISRKPIKLEFGRKKINLLHNQAFVERKIDAICFE